MRGTRIERIGREELGVTAALRLAKFFGTTAGLWMNLQKRYDIRVAERAIATEFDAIETFKRACRARRHRASLTLSVHGRARSARA